MASDMVQLSSGKCDCVSYKTVRLQKQNFLSLHALMLL